MQKKPSNSQEPQEDQEIHHGLCRLGHLVCHYSRPSLEVPWAPPDQGVPEQHGKISLVNCFQRRVKLL